MEARSNDLLAVIFRVRLCILIAHQNQAGAGFKLHGIGDIACLHCFQIQGAIAVGNIFGCEATALRAGEIINKDVIAKLAAAGCQIDAPLGATEVDACLADDIVHCDIGGQRDLCTHAVHQGGLTEHQKLAAVSLQELECGGGNVTHIGNDDGSIAAFTHGEALAISRAVAFEDAFVCQMETDTVVAEGVVDQIVEAILQLPTVFAE